ncbi:MAG: 5'/3'-nucleotidase SurE [bacterium]|nr:5'/3'-nucleotidase SurE [bacterium]
MKKPKILITNDDGINSPGLLASVEVACEFGYVVISAPSSQQTAMGRSLSGDKNAKLEPVNYEVNGVKVEAYSCDCSPASVIRHSMAILFQNDPPDLVISGINYGENIGATITSSGTVGAALESATYGIPSIAVSKETDINSHHKYTDQDWTATKHFLRLFTKKILSSKLPFDVDILKIDVPKNAEIITPWTITKQARIRHYSTEFSKTTLDTKLGEGTTIINKEHELLESNSDIHAMSIKKVVSVTPISLDLTSRVDLDVLDGLLKD